MVISFSKKISWRVMLALSFILELFCLAFFERPIFFPTHAAYFYTLLLPQTTIFHNFLSLFIVLCRSSLYDTNLIQEILLLTPLIALFYYTKHMLTITPKTQAILISFLLFAYIALASYFLAPFASHFPWTFLKIIANIIIIYMIIRYTS